MSPAPPPRQRRPSEEVRTLGLSIILVTALVAIVIVVVTHGTAGLADLATLMLSVSAVVVPMAAGRKRRKR